MPYTLPLQTSLNSGSDKMKNDSLKLKNLFSRENIKTIALILILIAIFLFLIFGLKFLLGTDHPLLVVSTESMCTATHRCDGFSCVMEPTLHIGDIIIVQGVENISQIKTGSFNSSNPWGSGDIIVFYNPQGTLIVHRAISREYDAIKHEWYIITKGDGNSVADGWHIYEDDIVGKVIFRIPLIGHVALFMQTLTGKVVFILIIIALVIWSLFPSPQEKENESKEEPKESVEEG